MKILLIVLLSLIFTPVFAENQGEIFRIGPDGDRTYITDEFERAEVYAALCLDYYLTAYEVIPEQKRKWQCEASGNGRTAYINGLCLTDFKTHIAFPWDENIVVISKEFLKHWKCIKYERQLE